MMRRAAPYIALFLSAAGTAVAAGPLLTGRGVANGTVSSVDIHDGSLHKVDLGRSVRPARGPRGAAGPIGAVGPTGTGPPVLPYLPVTPFVVRADGTTSTNTALAHVATGVYCYPGSAPLWADVTSMSTTTAQHVSAVLDPPVGPCPSGTTVRVTVVNASGVPADGPFTLMMGASG